MSSKIWLFVFSLKHHIWVFVVKEEVLKIPTLLMCKLYAWIQLSLMSSMKGSSFERSLQILTRDMDEINRHPVAQIHKNLRVGTLNERFFDTSTFRFYLEK